jgi:hypothetical protein
MIFTLHKQCTIIDDIELEDIYIHTAIPIIIEGHFQVFQWFSRSKLVLKAVESCFVALNYYGDGSSCTSFQQD